jgi:hypothetical protein
MEQVSPSTLRNACWVYAYVFSNLRAERSRSAPSRSGFSGPHEPSLFRGLDSVLQRGRQATPSGRQQIREPALPAGVSANEVAIFVDFLRRKPRGLDAATGHPQGEQSRASPGKPRVVGCTSPMPGAASPSKHVSYLKVPGWSPGPRSTLAACPSTRGVSRRPRPRRSLRDSCKTGLISNCPLPIPSRSRFPRSVEHAGRLDAAARGMPPR